MSLGAAHKSVLTKLTLNEQPSFATESSTQFVIEFGEELAVCFHGRQLIEREPGIEEAAWAAVNTDDVIGS
jgi:hypothetical protein